MTRPTAGAGWASLVLRLAVGTTFLAHGLQKVFVLGWEGVPNFAAWGIPLPEVTYPMTILVETLGGLALLLGWRVRLAGAALCVVMAGALVVVHLPYGFFLPGGVEFVLVLGAASAAVALLGPGRWALDARGRGSDPRSPDTPDTPEAPEAREHPGALG